MNYWFYFWTASFALALIAFVIITVIVLARGVGELKEMFANLRRNHPPSNSPPNAERR